LEVAFANNKLEKYFRDHKEAEKKFGKQVATRYIQRVTIIQSTQSIDELQKLPGLRCHPLKGVKQGVWAVKLVGRYRLTFTVEGESENLIRLLEVTNHYGD